MKPKKILIVEDSNLLQKGYNLLLRRYRNDGSTLLTATNGVEALARLAEHPDCDLIILDINMPEMSGIEFLNVLKATRKNVVAKIIISSTEGAESDIVRGLRAGADAYIVKPFKPDDLHELITQVTTQPAIESGIVVRCRHGASAE